MSAAGYQEIFRDLFRRGVLGQFSLCHSTPWAILTLFITEKKIILLRDLE
jgi:hypothetical protein